MPPRALLNPVWWAVINLLVTLYGIIFLQWSLQPIVYIFWIELILSVTSALIRTLTALGGRPYWSNLGERVLALLGGGVLGYAMVLLGVTFTFKAFSGGFQTGAFGNITWQVWALALNYLLALALHHFFNNRFRTASPIGEMMRTLLHLLVLLVLIMVITQYLLPRFPDANHVFWIGLAVVLVKFAVDLVFSRLSRPLEQLFTGK